MRIVGALLILAGLTGCDSREAGRAMARKEEVARIAERFGSLLVQADYASAQALLSVKARALHSPEGLKQAVEKMTSYAPGPIRRALLIPQGTLEDWPGRKKGELARLYVSLEGDAFQEAVSLLLVQEGDAILIQDLEWGRP